MQYLNWVVKVGTDINALTDVSATVTGFDLNRQLRLNQMATFSLQVTLDNRDGRFTPGGGGTFTSQDWLRTALVLQLSYDFGGSVSGTETLYYGQVVGFDLFDDSVTSNVTLSVLDPWTTLGRTKRGTLATFAATNIDTFIDSSSLSTPFSANMPAFNCTTVVRNMTVAGVGTPQAKIDTAVTGTTPMDAINNVLFAGRSIWAWPTLYTRTVVGSTSTLNHNASLVADTRATVNTDMKFADRGSFTTGWFLITGLTSGWNYDQTINQMNETSLATGAGSSSAENSTAVTYYGSRAATATTTSILTNSALFDACTKLVNRYSTPRFSPVSIRTSWSTILANTTWSVAAATALARIILFPFADKATVKWTGKAGSAQTATCIVLGSRIRATVEDFTIDLTLANWADNHDWVLDTDILGTDRLG